MVRSTVSMSTSTDTAASVVGSSVKNSAKMCSESVHPEMFRNDSSESSFKSFRCIRLKSVMPPLCANVHRLNLRRRG